MFTLTPSLLLIALAGSIMAQTSMESRARLAVSQSANQFGSSLLQTVTELNPGNLIMSPLSVDVVLAMAESGAQGETEKQFKSVLRQPSPDDFALMGYKSLIDNLNSIKQNKLALANKMFVNQNFSVKPTYKDVTENYFRSVTQSVNFAQSSEAANTINEWVRQNTNNKIDSIVTPDDVNSMTALVLVNAVYFKGQWKDKFLPTLTRDAPFHTSPTSVKNVRMMYKKGDYKYGELPSLGAKFVELPYLGDELSMLIILPDEVDGLQQVQQKLQDVAVADILNQGFQREVQIHLPKFKIESKIDLKPVLQKMGLSDMFSDRANFSGISDASIAVSKVIQKAYIEVNEEGSEAAAATGLTIMKLSLVIPIEFLINRPFYYAIIQATKEETGKVTQAAILFSGQVLKPTV